MPIAVLLLLLLCVVCVCVEREQEGTRKDAVSYQFVICDTSTVGKHIWNELNRAKSSIF